MLPDSENAPPRCFERSAYDLVSSDVLGEFSNPKRSIVYRQIGVLRASVPEATIHKNCQFIRSKYKIRFPEQAGVASPTCNFVGPHQEDERDFSFFVSLALYSGHHL